MKTKLLLLAVSLLATTLIFAQPTKKNDNNSCDKKVLKQIRKTLNYVDINDYLTEGETVKLILHCKVNANHEVEVQKIHGENEELKTAIIEILQDNPVKCENMEQGSYFSFYAKFILRQP